MSFVSCALNDDQNGTGGKTLGRRVNIKRWVYLHLHFPVFSTTQSSSECSYIASIHITSFYHTTHGTGLSISPKDWHRTPDLLVSEWPALTEPGYEATAFTGDVTTAVAALVSVDTGMRSGAVSGGHLWFSSTQSPTHNPCSYECKV